MKGVLNEKKTRNRLEEKGPKCILDEIGILQTATLFISSETCSL